MTVDMSNNRVVSDATIRDIDAVIVGAGMSGLFALHHLREKGLTCRVFDAAGGVGGTWYWNRYPGARVDLESVEYSYAWSDHLQQGWDWSERYAAQPELLRYLNHVADTYDLRRDIQLNTRVVAAIFDESMNRWLVSLDTGETYRSRFCVMATGFVSAPNKPHFPGLDRFGGDTYFSGEWPDEQVDFSGKRVAVIGTGSSGVQMIPLIAAEAEKVVVFQRTAPYVVPLRNQPMNPEYLAEVRRDYAEWRRREHESFGGYIALNFKMGKPLTELAAEVTPEERRADYENRWANGGLAFYTSYKDLFSDPEMNETLAEFIREKTRERIADPVLAEKLVPRAFPVLTKRLIADTGYYEAFNEHDIELVDISTSQISEIDSCGIIVDGRHYDVDAIVLATGFDAVTGAMARIDIRGRGGVKLTDYWSSGLRTHLGLMVAGFPNMFMVDGPGSPCAFFQPVLLQEYQIRWIGDAIAYLWQRGATTIEPSVGAEEAFIEHSAEIANATLFPAAKSWYMGSNVPGKPQGMLLYVGGFGEYRRHLDTARNGGYPGFLFSLADAPDGPANASGVGSAAAAHKQDPHLQPA